MELVIDQFTQCLVDMQTGDTVDTVFSKASTQYLQALTGWAFDWCGSDLESAEIYKLSVSGNTEAEGLVALQYMERDHAVYVQLAESAPHNRGAGRRYGGVGGHLFAIAAQKSLEAGYGGFFFMDAKNIELVRHYQETRKRQIEQHLSPCDRMGKRGTRNERGKRMLKLRKKVHPDLPHHAAEILQRYVPVSL